MPMSAINSQIQPKPETRSQLNDEIYLNYQGRSQEELT